MGNSTVRLVPLPEGSDSLLTSGRWISTYVGQEVVFFIPTPKRLPYIVLSAGQSATLGRSDPKSRQQPDIDLSLYGAVETGVSRLHAAIRCGTDTVTLIDLGSSNGTYLNAQPLMSHQPYILRDRDEIRLGKMLVYVLFGIPSSAASSNEA